MTPNHFNLTSSEEVRLPAPFYFQCTAIRLSRESLYANYFTFINLHNLKMPRRVTLLPEAL